MKLPLILNKYMKQLWLISTALVMVYWAITWVPTVIKNANNSGHGLLRDQVVNDFRHHSAHHVNIHPHSNFVVQSYKDQLPKHFVPGVWKKSLHTFHENCYTDLIQNLPINLLFKVPHHKLFCCYRI